jgi:hypothetical protein
VQTLSVLVHDLTQMGTQVGRQATGGDKGLVRAYLQDAGGQRDQLVLGWVF